MKKNNTRNSSLIFFFIFLVLIFNCLPSYAWDHSIEFGYGFSHDPNHTRYNNSGFLLSGDLVPFWWRTPWTFFSVTGSLGQLHTTAPREKNVTTVALSLALRAYPLRTDCCRQYHPYFLASFGPAYLSSRRFGDNTQGRHLSIQSNLGFGVEHFPFDINLRLQHFSNAGLSHPNQGFNVLYLLSIGYLF
jgi:hypothetical protein